MNRDTIIAHIHDIDAQSLFDYIQKGIFSLEELMKTGNLDHQKRMLIQRLLKEENKRDDDAYQNACNQRTIDAYQQYLDRFPAGQHIREANGAITLLKIIIDEGFKKIRDILDNPNNYTPLMIKDIVDQGVLSWEALLEHYPLEIINKLKRYNPVMLQLGETPEKIDDGYTEVYFWGIPGSGKTCALSAVLSCADRSGRLRQEEGTGFGYLTDLINIFNDKIGILPNPTPVYDKTQYLPFYLKKDATEKRARKIGLVELSGEVFQCFDDVISKKQFKTLDHQETFTLLEKYLQGTNRKMHFFFIDYSKNNELDIDYRRTQANYLNAASLYFRNRSIFKNTTDAIYLVITKSDLMPFTSQEQKNEEAKRFVTEKFSGFVNGLKDICKKYDINGGVLTVIPFSLGEVFFQKICKIDDFSSNKIIDILIERIRPQKEIWTNVLNK